MPARRIFFKPPIYRITNKNRFWDKSDRRYLRARLAEEFGKFKRYTHPFSLIMFDIDFFKPINDSYGHPCGDYILRAFSALLVSSIRSTDIVARYGGEEFCCLLPEANIDQAKDLAERIRVRTMEAAFTYHKFQLKITVSGGVAEMIPGIASVDALLEAADKALYRAKETGRNKIVVG